MAQAMDGRIVAGSASREAHKEQKDTPKTGSVEETRRADPDAPALGAIDGAEEIEELPEPQEPG